MTGAASIPSADLLYESASGGLLVADTSGLIRRANQTFCDWLGYAPAELIDQQRFTKLLTMGNQLFCQTHWTPLLQIQGSVGEVKLEFKHRDGHLVPMIVNCARRRHGGIELDEIFALRILDRHKYEKELIEARRRAEDLSATLADTDRKKDEFLATLSHELRNPLAPMRNVIEILKRKDISDPMIVWGRDVIGRQLSYMQHLIDDLLEASRIAQGKIVLRMATVDLTSIMTDALEAVRPAVEGAGHRVTVHYPPKPIEFLADRTRLTQILVNLLNNAVKFTPNGGAIELSGHALDGEVTITVSDSGMGIEQHALGRVFDMFTQIGASGQQGGLGIGLALAQGLALLHGGSVIAESAGLGRGSTFSVRVPNNRSSIQATAVESQLPEASSFSLTVLVIDDNVDSAHSMTALLELIGHQARFADSGTAGLRLAEEIHPDVVLLDIGLPDLDGYQVARQIRSNHWGAESLLIATTGWGQETDKALAEAAGFNHHFTKPVDVTKLEAALRGYSKRFGH